LDRQDPLAGFRDRFIVDELGLVYLDGNSLGRLPRAAAELAQDLVGRQWGRRLIRGWNEGWLDLPERLGGKIARLIGAEEDEVLVADSTSVNLFKLAVAALRARPQRPKIVTDDLNFPSDLYVLQESSREDYRLEVVPSPDGVHGPEAALAEAVNHDTGLVSLSHTTFKSGFVYDLAAVTALAHRAGALVLWDLSHSVGAVPVDLGAAGADLAVGCTYKYLNGGPGAPAFLYVRRGLQQRLANPIAGWFGRADPFGFELEYKPAPGLRHFLTGTPPVLSTALVEPGVDLVLEAGMDRVRAKSVAQSEYFIGLWEEWLAPQGFTLNSPCDSGRRGSHVSLGHPEGWRINRALIDREGVVPDFRLPDNLRFGICPLYTTYAELHAAADALRRVVAEERYLRYSPERRGVT
jgi:kynureninase